MYFLKGSPGQLKNNRLVAELGPPMSSTLDGIIFAVLGRDLLKRAVAMGLGRKHSSPTIFFLSQTHSKSGERETSYINENNSNK